MAKISPGIRNFNQEWAILFQCLVNCGRKRNGIRGATRRDAERVGELQEIRVVQLAVVKPRFELEALQMFHGAIRVVVVHYDDHP